MRRGGGEDSGEDLGESAGQDNHELDQEEEDADGNLADLIVDDDEVEREAEEAEKAIEADRLIEEEHEEDVAGIQALVERYASRGGRGKKRNRKIQQDESQGEALDDDELVAQFEEEEGRKPTRWEIALMKGEEASTQVDDHNPLDDSEEEEDDKHRREIERKVSIYRMNDSSSRASTPHSFVNDESSRSIINMTRKTNLPKLAGRSKSTGLDFSAFNKSISLQKPKLKRRNSFIGKPLTKRQSSTIKRKLQRSSISLMSGGNSRGAGGHQLHRQSSSSAFIFRDASLPPRPDSMGLPLPPLKRSLSSTTVRPGGPSAKRSKTSASVGGMLFAAIAKSRFKRPTQGKR